MEKGKKIIAFVFISVILFSVLLSVLVAGLSTERKECRENCSVVSGGETRSCNYESKICKEVCNEEKKSCLDSMKAENKECTETCKNLSNLESRPCLRECSKIKTNKSQECYKGSCVKDCNNESKTCKEDVKKGFLECRNGCDENKFLMNQTECELTGGFHFSLCNGPYFDLVCSSSKYCICEGDLNYTCPSNYSCYKEIKNLLPRKSQTIEGFKDGLGNPLGDIGVCKGLL